MIISGKNHLWKAKAALSVRSRAYFSSSSAHPTTSVLQWNQQIQHEHFPQPHWQLLSLSQQAAH